MDMAGRPLKFKQKLQVISIALEPSFISFLEEKAKEQGRSRNEYITALLLSADKETGNLLIHHFSELKKVIEEQQKTIKQYNERLEKIGRLNIEQYLFKEISEREDLKQMVSENKERIIKVLKMDSEVPLTERVDSLANELLKEYEMNKLKEGLFLKHKAEVKAVLKHFILSFLSF